MKYRIIFLPLLLIYISIVLLASSNELVGDEGRYVMYATNLTNGYYSPQDRIDLWNGPGYPLVLAPFIKLKLPLMTAKLLNPLSLFMALLYFHKTLLFYMKDNPAIFYSYLLGLYLPFCRFIHQLLTEPLTVFLVCGFLFHFCRLCREKKGGWSLFLVPSVYLGYLALTKILFGYVIMIGIVVYFFMYLWKKRDEFRKTFLVYALALIFCIPYLLYTYSLTDKMFFWGDSGGRLMYYMSSPNPYGLGDWHERYSGMHHDVYKQIAGLSTIESDIIFKKKAVENILNHPKKYLLNWMANIGRLLFNYPFSYDKHKLSSYFYIIPNMFLVVVFILCLYPSYAGRTLIPYELYAVLFLAAVSFAGLSVASSENRYFWPLVPIFMLWISFILARVLKIEMQQ